MMAQPGQRLDVSLFHCGLQEGIRDENPHVGSEAQKSVRGMILSVNGRTHTSASTQRGPEAN